MEKKESYRQLELQVSSLLEGETDRVANLSNALAAIQAHFNFFWIGYYLLKGDELVLGPFQGPVACTRIAKGKGVCGKAWEQGHPILVPDVDKFPGHIACSSLSQSELVVPIRDKHKTYGVLDIDSEELNSFDLEDQEGMVSIAAVIAKGWSTWTD